MDPFSVVAAGYFVEKAGGKDLLVRILGPMADELGTRLKQLVYKNLESIFKTADDKIKARNIPQEVPSSIGVLNEILKDGIYQEGELYAEYYGGVLASSKLADRNDIGKSICQLITRLSAYDLRFHFAIYMCFRNKLKNININLGDSSDCEVCRIFIPKNELEKAMDFSEEELLYKDIIFNNCLRSLSREGLIGVPFSFGTKEFMKQHYGVNTEGFSIAPSDSGAGLLLWAEGYGLRRPGDLFLSSIEVGEAAKIHIPLGHPIGKPPKNAAGGDVMRLKELYERIKRN